VDRTGAAEVAKLLANAKRPAILAGHGVTVSRAWDELYKLAANRKIPVATTPKAKGVFPEQDPLSLGVFGGFGGHPRAEAYLLADYVDVLLVIGSSMNEIATNSWDPNLKPQEALVQIDVDPREIGKNYAVDVGLVGDARATLHEINEQLAVLGPPPPAEPDPLNNLREEIPRHLGTEYRDAPDRPFKPQRLVEVLREAIPDDALLFIDNGNSLLWGGHYFEARRPNTYFLSIGMASMGIAGPAAIGAKLGAPRKKVVALVGDGAFAMNGMEVHTAADHRIPVVWVVLSNGGLGMVYHGERMILGEDLGACRYNIPIDVAAMARAMGATAFVADSPQTFREAMDRALETRGPSVIDATVDGEEVPHLLAKRARAVAKAFDNLPPSLRVPPWPKRR
jgi:acetolactate synthase-1/2/3 large subunit